EGLFGDLTDRQQDSLQRMRGAAEHLLSIINDILDLSRVEAGKVQLTDTDVDLVTLLPRFCNSMQPLAERKGITYVTDIDPDLPVVRTDWTRLGQVMLNLLSNAVKFTERGSVTLRAQRAGAEGVRIDVVDTGIGIPAEHLDSIFEEFTQVDRLWRREQ